MTLGSQLRVLHERIRLKPAPGSFSQSTILSNHDLDPVPQEKRTWGAFDYVSYWTSDQFAPATWELGSSLVAVGLTAREAIPIAFFGFLVIGVVIVLHGRIGAVYHVPFPVANRSTWGIWGSVLPVIGRSVLALMWLSILTYNGGLLVEQLLIALSPRFGNMPNTFPASAVITSRQLLCVFIYSFIQTPISLIPITKLKYFFALKAIVCPPSFIAIGIWCLVKTKGGGPIVTGSMADFVVGNKGWAVIRGLNAITGLYSTVAVNIADFTRYARNPGATWVQAPAIAVTGAIPVACAFFAADWAQTIHGANVWDPASLVNLFESRAARVFIAIQFLISTIGVNISANSVSFATDCMSLFPAYMDLFRGGVLAAVLAIIIFPWKIVSSAPAFYNFLGAYSCWLGPISGVCLAGYYVIFKQRLDVRELYNHPDGIYSYTYGINWRAFAAFFCGFAPNIPGFLNAIAPTVTKGTNTYFFGWYFGFFVSFVSYVAICKLFPLPAEALVDVAVYPDDVDRGYEKDVDHVPTITLEHNMGEKKGSDLDSEEGGK